MRNKRQNNQLELDFMIESKGEARATVGEGTESRVAEDLPQSPALEKSITVRTAVYGTVCTVVWEGGAVRFLPIPINMIRKGQVEGIGKGDIRGQVRFVADLFKVAA